MRALVTGGLIVGALDILDAFVFFYLRSGVKPARILQAISAGLLGRQDAFRARGHEPARTGGASYV